MLLTAYPYPGIEFRAMIDGLDLETPLKDGIRIKVSLDMLVEKVFVAPGAPKWFEDLVVSVLERFGFPNAAGIVQHTELDSDAYM